MCNGNCKCKDNDITAPWCRHFNLDGCPYIHKCDYLADMDTDNCPIAFRINAKYSVSNEGEAPKPYSDKSAEEYLKQVQQTDPCNHDPKRPYCASADECVPMHANCSSRFRYAECPLMWDQRCGDATQKEASRAPEPPHKAVGQADPHDIPQHAPGAKLDKGKPRVGMMFASFPDALMAVAEVATFGADKYSDFGWEHVQDALERYFEATGRHILKSAKGIYSKKFRKDKESGINELAHVAWDILAVLQKSIEHERGGHE